MNERAGATLEPSLEIDRWPAIQATHRDLSPVAERFLEYVLEHPEAARWLDYRQAGDRSDWVRVATFPLQPWPLFLGEEKRRQIERATVELLRLIRGIPERVFDNDARRIAEYYGGFSEPILMFLLAPPNGIGGSLGRCDFLDDGTALRCLEANMTAFLGGWQLRFWDRACLESPAIASFVRQEGIHPVHRDPWRAAFTHVVQDVHAKGLTTDGTLNIGLVAGVQITDDKSEIELNELYSDVLAATGHGLSGRLFACSYTGGGLVPKNGRLFHRGVQIHALVEYTNEMTPREIYHCFKAERLGLYNGPLTNLLGDKRNLALLSQLAESDRFTREEREFLHTHVPWSREVVDGRTTTFEGETASLLDFALARRERLVLKEAQGSGGSGVYIGCATPPEEWEKRLRTAAGGKGWLLQELVRSRPYLGQDGDRGPAPQDVVWGTFGFGGVYGGAFLRMLPQQGTPGVINAARGATEGFVFEV